MSNPVRDLDREHDKGSAAADRSSNSDELAKWGGRELGEQAWEECRDGASTRIPTPKLSYFD